MMQSPIDWLTWGIVGYFILARSSYFLLNVLSIFRLRDIEQSKVLADLPQFYSGLEQPISVLLATHDEAGRVVASVQSLLQLEYSTFEIIVVNDGSRDATMAELTSAFDLHPFPEAYRVQLATQAVTGIYRSTRHPNLRVIDKEHGGAADALNAGINATRYPLFCGIDTGTILRRDSLQRIVAPFLNESRVVATAAALRVGNGCETANGFIGRIALPERWLPRFQIINHLRVSLFAPLGWSMLDAMLIAPPGICLFRKDAVIEAGGYSKEAAIGSTELIVRLHRTMRGKRQPYHIRFVADPVCWKIMPENLHALKDQRMLWQQGLSDALHLNTGLMTRRNGGVPGRIAFPFLALFEAWGPLIEVLGYAFMLIAFACGLVSIGALCAFLTVAIGFGILLSASGLLLEEMSFQLYPKTADILILMLAAVLGNLGYAQLDAGWRALAMLRSRRRDEKTVVQSLPSPD